MRISDWSSDVCSSDLANKGKWSGTLVMIGQPAEERGAGARMMLEDGLYTRFPKPEYVLAFHDAAQFPAGKFGYTPGYALRSEERRVGKAGGSTCKFRWSALT